MNGDGIMIKKIIFSAILSVPLISLAGTDAENDRKSGRIIDNAYAQKVWQVLKDEKLIGNGRMRSYPFVGSRPHGSIQEIITHEIEVEGVTGRVIVKHNYGAKSELSPKQVYSGKNDKHYEALTIMFKREAGYDPANNDWFWAEYKKDGSIINYNGVDLSGRSSLCLGCHTPLGGPDREIMNGNQR